jgi:hypothetical protein
VLIVQGKVSGFQRLPWAQIELASDARLEEIVLHLVRWVKKRPEAYRILFPVGTRDLGGVELFYPNILIQTKDWTKLKDIRTVMGIQGLTTDGQGALLLMDAEYGEALVAQAEEVSSGWSKDIKRGSFVRVLLGERRMLCGEVIKIDSGIADVRVSLTVRDLRLRIPVRALLKLDVPKERRKYFYGRS